MNDEVAGQGARHALALHCGLASGAAFRRLAHALTPHLSLTAPDLVGHGSGPLYDPNRDLHDQAMAALVQHWPEGRFDLIGHSFGATLALRIAIEAPERVRSLILFEPVLFAAAQRSELLQAYLDHPDFNAFAEASAAQDTSQSARAFLRLWGDGERLSQLPPERQAALAEQIPIIWASEQVLFQDTARLVPRLNAIQAPCLLLHGSKTQPIAAEIARRLTANIPQAELAILPGAGHMGPITHPVEMAARINAFLNL